MNYWHTNAMNGSQEDYAEWKLLDKKEYTLYDSKRHKETLGDNIHIHFLDCGDECQTLTNRTL